MPGMTDGFRDLTIAGVAGCNRITLMSAIPTSIADITGANALGSDAMTGADFSIADHPTDGRQLNIVQKTVTGASAGAAAYVAHDDGVNFAWLDFNPAVSVTVGVDVIIAANSYSDRDLVNV